MGLTPKQATVIIYRLTIIKCFFGVSTEKVKWFMRHFAKTTGKRRHTNNMMLATKLTVSWTKHSQLTR